MFVGSSEGALFSIIYLVGCSANLSVYKFVRILAIQMSLLKTVKGAFIFEVALERFGKMFSHFHIFLCKINTMYSKLIIRYISFSHSLRCFKGLNERLPHETS